MWIKTLIVWLLLNVEADKEKNVTPQEGNMYIFSPFNVIF